MTTSNDNAAVKNAEAKAQGFRDAMQAHIDAMQKLIDTHLADAGNIEEDSQKLTLTNALNTLDNTVAGTDWTDMGASWDELTKQLEWFCAKHNLPLMSADELLVEPEVRVHQELIAWLEYFIARWEACV